MANHVQNTLAFFWEINKKLYLWYRSKSFFTSNLFRAKVTVLTTMGEAIGTKMRSKEVGGRRIRKLTKVRAKLQARVFRFFATPEQLDRTTGVC